MPYAKVEPKGCVERHGNVQVKLSFYLEPGDARYNEHHVRMPVVPPEGYPDEVDEQGVPADLVAYQSWWESLPKAWQTNPFHNHLMHVPPETTDEEIQAAARLHLANFYAVWAAGRPINAGWKNRTKPARDFSLAKLSACEVRVATVKRNLPSLMIREVSRG